MCGFHEERICSVAFCNVMNIRGGRSGVTSEVHVRVPFLYNALHTVNTQQYISTVIQYIQLGRITATCFDRKRSSSSH